MMPAFTGEKTFPHTQETQHISASHHRIVNDRLHISSIESQSRRIRSQNKVLVVLAHTSFLLQWPHISITRAPHALQTRSPRSQYHFEGIYVSGNRQAPSPRHFSLRHLRQFSDKFTNVKVPLTSCVTVFWKGFPHIVTTPSLSLCSYGMPIAKLKCDCHQSRQAGIRLSWNKVGKRGRLTEYLSQDTKWNRSLPPRHSSWLTTSVPLRILNRI